MQYPAAGLPPVQFAHCSADGHPGVKSIHVLILQRFVRRHHRDDFSRCMVPTNQNCGSSQDVYWIPQCLTYKENRLRASLGKQQVNGKSRQKVTDRRVWLLGTGEGGVQTPQKDNHRRKTFRSVWAIQSACKTSAMPIAASGEFSRSQTTQ